MQSKSQPATIAAKPAQISVGGARAGAGRKPSGRSIPDRVMTALRDGEATVGDLSDELGVKVGPIHAALSELQRDGRVRVAGMLHNGRRGAPTKLYAAA